MEISSQDEEMPIPINSTYGGGGQVHVHGHGLGHGHMIHHEPAVPQNHIYPSSNGPISAVSTLEDHVPYKKIVRYRECLKNHAAAMGGNATDGCGEFMPSGEEGTLEALTCSACNCHRNFHRKETEGDPSSCDCYHNSRVGRKFILGHHHRSSILGPEPLGGYPTGTLVPSRAAHAQPHQMIMSYNLGSIPSESDEQEACRPPQMIKKRFRTKFTQEQKEKMLNFAERVGWKFQKQEENVVQQFCQEIGVKRRVLKVWMHNNKHNLGKKNSPPTTVQNQI